MNQLDLKKYLRDGYLPTIGIECHVQLKTVSKLFTAIGNQSTLHHQANSLVGPLCLGLPGALPVVNQKAIDLAIIAGLALEAEIAEFTSFDRKHYFYPDLPLGYQISQHYFPIILGACLEIALAEQQSFQVRIQKAHLEADAAKLTHQAQADFSLLDLNRVGSPLLEIVSHPDMHSPQEAKQYAKELYLRMVYAEVCEGDLSAGNLRFDVNISLSKKFDQLGVRTEIKNLNSFRFIEQALNYEIDRQIGLLKAGQLVEQQTRGWDETNKQTFAQRSKEEAQDYRYMPDPDIPPFKISQTQIDNLRQDLPTTPTAIRQLFKQWQIAFKIQEIILEHPQIANCLYSCRSLLSAEQAQLLSKWMVGDILALINKKELDWSAVIQLKDELRQLATLSLDKKINSTMVKQWLNLILVKKIALADLVKDLKPLADFDQVALQALIKRVFEQFPQAVVDAQKDIKAAGFLIGQVIKLSQNQADPRQVAGLVRQFLKDFKP